MRKVKIVSDNNFMESTVELERLINEAFREIDKSGGEIIKTQYCVSKNGYAKEAVIEYEVNENIEGKS